MFVESLESSSKNHNVSFNSEFVNFLDVCCNFKECLERMSWIKLLAEVLLITKMNTVIGKYIKGLNIFLSYLT